MRGTAALKITYVALGTGSTTPNVNGTRLGVEAYRKAVTSFTNGASTGELLIDLYLNPSDALGLVITEIGFFGGNATSSANTGSLLAWGSYSHTRPSTPGTESIQFQLDFTA